MRENIKILDPSTAHGTAIMSLHVTPPAKCENSTGAGNIRNFRQISQDILLTALGSYSGVTICSRIQKVTLTGTPFF